MAIPKDFILKCKMDYIANENSTVEAIALKYKIKPTTLLGYANRDKWSECKQTYQTDQQKIIMSQLETDLPREIIQKVRNRLIKASVKAIDTIELVRDGKAGKGAYNRLLASKDILDRNGIKGEDQINIKISKISEVLDKITINTPNPKVLLAESVGTVLNEGKKETSKYNGNQEIVNIINQNENADRIRTECCPLERGNTLKNVMHKDALDKVHTINDGLLTVQAGTEQGSKEPECVKPLQDKDKAGSDVLGGGAIDISITPSLTDSKKESFHIIESNDDIKNIEDTFKEEEPVI